MKIVFLVMPWKNRLGFYRYLIGAKTSNPPIGLCYLASVARKLGHSVSIIDADVGGIYNAGKLAELLIAMKPDVLGITSVTDVHNDATLVAGLVKEKSPGTIVVFGGPHTSAVRKEVMERSTAVDYAVYGEGEETFKELLLALEGQIGFDGIGGLIRREAGKIIESQPRSRITELDALDYPARDLLKNEFYQMFIPGRGSVKATGISSTRGCPYQCSYCGLKKIFGDMVVFRDPSKVVEEMVSVKNLFGIDHFIFYDDTLTLNREHVLELCRHIKSKKINITFEGSTRVDANIDEELLSEMKSAGLVRIGSGVEAVNPDVLKNIRKNISIQDIIHFFSVTKKLRIEGVCNIIFGLPGDTKRNIKETIRFIKKVNCNLTIFYTAVPYPGTELYEMAEKGMHGLRLIEKDYARFHKYTGSVMEVNDLSVKELKRLQFFAYLNFYLSPKVFFNKLQYYGLYTMHFIVSFMNVLLRKTYKDLIQFLNK